MVKKKPRYVVIKEYILNQIEKGKYKENEKIASENELCKQFSVTRMTVRQAINELVNDNTLYSVPKIGVFVCRKSKFKNFDGLNSFTEDSIRNRGKTHSKIVLSELDKADKTIAAELGIAEGDPVWHLERVRFINDETVVYEDDYLNYAITGDITKKIAEKSLFNYFENFLELTIAYSDQQIIATLADQKLSEALNIEENQPLLKVTSNTILHDGQCIEYGHTYYRVDKFTFTQVAYRHK